MAKHEKEVLLQVPATLVSAKTRMRYWSFGFDTQENVPPDHIALVASLHQKTGWLSFLVSEADRMISFGDVTDLAKIDPDKGKSPGKRLHNVLYLLWEQDHAGHPVFGTYYEMEMERIIAEKKSNLPPR
jgi:hypothetical protein